MSFIGNTTAYPTATPVSADLIPFVQGGVQKTALFSSFGAGGGAGPTTFTAFGDSITVGNGASTLGVTSYVPVLAGLRSWTATNNAVSGDMVGDQAAKVFLLTGADSQQCTYYCGFNDARVYNVNVAKQAGFKRAHMASICWLALRAAYRTAAQASASTGVWSNMAQYGGTLGVSSTAPGATRTFTTYGSVVYVTTILQAANTSTFTIAIDGVSMGTFSSGLTNGADPSTANGLNYIPAVLRLPGLTEGPHTVVFTVASLGGVNPTCYCLWASGNGGHQVRNGPSVWVSNIERMPVAGYVASVGGADFIFATYNEIIRDNCRTLAYDGLNVTLIDTAAVILPATDVSVDNIHPNDTGHAKIAAAFYEAMVQSIKPRQQGQPDYSPTFSVSPAANSYVLGVIDQYKKIRINSAAAGAVIVPPYSYSPIEIGARIRIGMAGAGTTYVLAGGASVTINNSLTGIAAQGQEAVLTNVAADVWDLSGPLVAGTPPLGYDASFASVLALLHGDSGQDPRAGTNLVVDSSALPFPMTQDGVAGISALHPKFGNGAMNFTVAGDRVWTAWTAAFDYGTGDLTVEAWAYFNNAAAAIEMINDHWAGNIAMYRTATGKLEVAQSSVAALFTGTTTITTGTWHHVAVTRTGGTMRVFLDGAIEASGANATNFASTGTGRIIMWGRAASGFDMNGQIDDARLTKGVARYTGVFTPPVISHPNF